MIGFLSLFLSVSAALADPSPVRPVPPLNNIIWVWLENTPASQMILQPYTKSIISTYPNAKFTNFLPTSGVTQANAMMMIGGSDFGVHDNSVVHISSPTLIDLLESKSIAWKVYAEDYPGSCYLGAGVADYKRYRIPFLSISRISSDPYECMRVQGFRNLSDDIKYNTLPRFSVVIPNLSQSGGTGGVLAADNTLQAILDPIMTAPGFTSNTTIIISTLNNSNTSPGKKEMFTMFIGAGLPLGILSTVSTPYSHANVLKTIEVGLGLGSLNQSDATAVPMVGFWKSFFFGSRLRS